MQEEVFCVRQKVLYTRQKCGGGYSPISEDGGEVDEEVLHYPVFERQGRVWQQVYIEKGLQRGRWVHCLWPPVHRPTGQAQQLGHELVNQ